MNNTFHFFKLLLSNFVRQYGYIYLIFYLLHSFSEYLLNTLQSGK
nr:MAG TPA: hypothetical protein [Caudoviricetes sp.]